MNDQDKEAFERWWNEEGSGMPPKPGEETEHFARRMTEIAWMNGVYAARDDAKLKRVTPMPIAEPGEGTIGTSRRLTHSLVGIKSLPTSGRS